MYMYVYVYVYIYICMYMYMYIYIYVCMEFYGAIKDGIISGYILSLYMGVSINGGISLKTLVVSYDIPMLPRKPQFSLQKKSHVPR